MLSIQAQVLGLLTGLLPILNSGEQRKEVNLYNQVKN